MKNSEENDALIKEIYKKNKEINELKIHLESIKDSKKYKLYVLLINIFKVILNLKGLNLMYVKKVLFKIRKYGAYYAIKAAIGKLNNGSISEKKYIEFIQLNNKFNSSKLDELRPEKIKFSIIIPVYNPNIEELKEAFSSAKNQNYTDFEIVIVDDASNNTQLNYFFDQINHEKNTIIVKNKYNLGISNSLNVGVSHSNHEFLLFLDQDDVLDSNALLWFSYFILRNKNSKLLYSDEDCIDSWGLRFSPFFKPDWSPERLRRQNYINHALVVKKNLAEKFPFQKEFDGSQDHNFLLQITETLAVNEIVHVPKVLYSWRIHNDDTKSFSQFREYQCKNLALNAVNCHLNRLDIKAKLRLQNPDYIRIKYEVNSEYLVSIVIPTRNRIELLKNSIDSVICNTIWGKYEIIVVDNDSDDSETLKYLDKLRSTKNFLVINSPGEFNFSHLNNIAINQSKSDFICMLNNDIEVINGDWLIEMISLAQFPDIGVVGAKLLYATNRIQHVGLACGIGGVAGHSFRGKPRDFYGGPGTPNNVVHEVLAVTGACCVFKKTLWEEVNGFDEQNLKIAYNDVDFCLKAYDKGYRNLITPYACLYHLESASRGPEIGPRKIAHDLEYNWMINKWGALLKNDPYYNSNLTLENEQHDLRIL